MHMVHFAHAWDRCVSMSLAIRSRSRLGGTPSSSTWAAARISDQAVDRISSETSTDRIGSIGVQPVARMTSAATIAAAEPSRSPSTCRMAPRMLRLSRSPPCSTKKEPILTSRPRIATTSIGPPSTGAGRMQAVPGLVDDPQRDDEDGDAVGVGDQRLDPAEAIGEPAGGRPRPRDGRHTRQGRARPHRPACGRHRPAAPATR